MNIEIEIWSTRKGKDGKLYCTIEHVHKLNDKEIEAKALEEYKQTYGNSNDVEYEARISKTIID